MSGHLKGAISPTSSSPRIHGRVVVQSHGELNHDIRIRITISGNVISTGSNDV
jgi:hypothetical protein